MRRKQREKLSPYELFKWMAHEVEERAAKGADVFDTAFELARISPYADAEASYNAFRQWAMYGMNKWERGQYPRIAAEGLIERCSEESEKASNE